MVLRCGSVRNIVIEVAWYGCFLPGSTCSKVVVAMARRSYVDDDTGGL